jgi:lysophospholipase L1-like esterase
MRELNVPVNDLHSVLSDPGQPNKLAELIGGDGVHLAPAAKKLLGKTVAAFVAQHLPADEP